MSDAPRKDESRIIIDDWSQSQPHLLWYCDICDVGELATAQFPNGHGGHVTVCAGCLNKAIDGIAASLGNPVTEAELLTDSVVMP